jgi:hypothetical protein
VDLVETFSGKKVIFIYSTAKSGIWKRKKCNFMLQYHMPDKDISKSVILQNLQECHWLWIWWEPKLWYYKFNGCASNLSSLDTS